MKKTVEPRYFSQVIQALIDSDCKTAFKVIDEKTVIHATWKFKPSGRHSREEIIVTFGAPNYLDRILIKKCKKAGEPFPIKKIQFRKFPVKR